MQALDGSKVIIYGTGGNGVKLASLIKDVCSIEFFLDKRADDIRFIDDIPVRKLDFVNELKNKGQYIVFITIKDVFSHTIIAKELMKRGMNYIVYKPDNVLRDNGDEIEKGIDDVYETLVERKQYLNGMKVPKTGEIRCRLRNRLLISDDNEEVRAWCPVELLFNYKDSYDYPGINMPLFFPIVELYKYLLGQDNVEGKEVINNFVVYACEWLKVNNKVLSESQKNSFIESRISVFGEMQKLTEVDNDFFKKNGPTVEYEGGKFFLSASGRNRVSFLIAKGYKYVPVKMKRADYDKWCDIEYVKRIEKKINEGGVKSFFAAEPNPYLVDYNIDFIDYQRRILIPVANRIIKEIYMQCRYDDKTLTCTDFDKVEELKTHYRIECDVDDNGISERYFNSIGIGNNNIQAENVLKIMISKEKRLDGAENIGEFWFDGCLYNGYVIKDGNTNLHMKY